MGPQFQHRARPLVFVPPTRIRVPIPKWVVMEGSVIIEQAIQLLASQKPFIVKIDNQFQRVWTANC